MNIKRSTFRLKPAFLNHQTRYKEFRFRDFMVDSGQPLHCPVIAEVCGDAVRYGELFAYCFRRFGYPNIGWDGYKQLASYVLSTPHPDLFLSITPYVGDTSVITFQFLVPLETLKVIDSYAARDGNYYDRPANWRDMDAGDPLKPLAQAAVIALQDLRRPVSVRGTAIDAFGLSDGDQCVKPAKSAGYPSGDLGNYVPDEFAQLHGLILEIGKGNPKMGIKKVLKHLGSQVKS